MSRRRLSEEERTLWSGVTRSVAPLRQPVRHEPAAGEARSEPAAGRPKTSAKLKSPRQAAPPPAPQPPAPPPLMPLGRRFRQRIARGTRPIDGRLDLHGLTQAEAHHALLGFLRSSQARGASVVLVITGKGATAGEGTHERGVLKRQVPLWLRLPEFRRHVIGFEAAGAGHGGEGALYVSLRKRRADDR
jgi:DNA-nicking Smr family endonuclease